jgi:hypothetical protein
MADHMNVFEPYATKAAHHEDALTRAFLLVLRGVPVAHASWLNLVDRSHRAAGGSGVPWLHDLGTPAIRTQTASVTNHVIRVISLVQTDEVYFREGSAKASERRQVLDGVVNYGETLAIVVENKPRHQDIWEGQLDINVPPGVPVDPVTACVAWRDIVVAWGGLLEAGHLGPAEALLLGDFLDYVEEHFAHLRPYSKVSLCGQDVERLKRRCRMVLQAIAGAERVEYHRGWSWFIRLDDGRSATQLALIPMRAADGLGLVIEIDPGDTTRQGKALYRECALAEVAALAEHGWTVVPNFHLAHITLNLMWTTGTLSLADYWTFWLAHRDWMRKWRREDFESAWTAFEVHGLVTAADRPKFDAKVVSTNRSSFNLCPGLTLRWRARLDEAALIDQRGQLEAVVKREIARAGSAFRLALPWSGGVTGSPEPA